MEKVRVRFAPSPTGPLHLGGVRTVLLAFLILIFTFVPVKDTPIMLKTGNIAS